MRPVALSWWPSLLGVGPSDLFSWEYSGLKTASLFWVIHGVTWERCRALGVPRAQLQLTTASPCHSFLFVGTRALGEKRYNGLVFVWVCQRGNCGRGEAFFGPLGNLDNVSQSKLFKMLSTVYDILVKILINPALFSDMQCDANVKLHSNAPRYVSCSVGQSMWLFMPDIGNPDNLVLSL